MTTTKTKQVMISDLPLATGMPGRDGEDGADAPMIMNTPFHPSILPLFVYAASDWTPVSNTWTKLHLDTSVSDIETSFDAVTNFRYTPKIAGVYLIIGSVGPACDDGGLAAASIYKNGAAIFYQYQKAGFAGTTSVILTVSGLVQMNGTTDYIELFGASQSTAPKLFGGQTVCFLQAARLRLD